MRSRREAVAALGVLMAATSLACSGAPPEPPAAAPASAAATAKDVVAVKPLRATMAVPEDVDDPAIWLHPTDRSRSLIFGTVKVPAPVGALAVFGLDGQLRQQISGIDRPNNVDVEYGLDLDGSPTDIAVVTERLKSRLRVFAIARDGSGVREISGGSLAVLAGMTGEEAAPMGVALYRRPRDGAIFAIVSPKAGPRTNYLWQYRITDDGTGRAKATFVRRFGGFSGQGEIEAVAVDDELGYVYYADETSAISKWHADPDAAGADRELARFGAAGFQQDREGLGIYALPGGEGYLVAVDQLPGESIFHVYKREGEPGRPHDHSAVVKSFRIGADGTDGLELTSADLGPDFPDGLLVAMNSASRNFLLVRWADIAAAGAPTLRSTARPAPVSRPASAPR